MPWESYLLGGVETLVGIPHLGRWTQRVCPVRDFQPEGPLRATYRNIRLPGLTGAQAEG